MKLQIGERLWGFLVEEIRPLEEISATMYQMRYEQNGAQLIWLDREDENKTFAISFKTIPQDDTGVFHILEHSVLCGSRNYPVKEPFVDLLKSSLQTFLNAMTFPDKTMYPVCSKNPQDFLNLMDVYLDAVFHPLSLERPEAFWQEGWHYELEDQEGELRCNGVVYNEMKGAYADPDTILSAELNRLLFPDNCYGCESGGHPDHITELTYAQYLDSHRRFYHPSNARIFLDGTMDLEEVLARINGFLQEYDAQEVCTDIPRQMPVAPPEKTAAYEIGAGEDPERRVLLADGWVFGDFDDPERSLGVAVLCNALCSSNEAPLNRALLESGLAEDVKLFPVDGVQQLYVTLVVRNTSLEQKEGVRRVIRETLTKLAEEGLDHQRLHAILNRFEFNFRERDFGTMPRGLIYAMAVHDTWLYGGDPAQSLCLDALFATLRNRVDEGWFEALIRSILLENPHHAQLCLVPDAKLGEAKRQAEVKRLAEEKAAWSRERIEQVMEEFAQLRRAQERENTPEEKQTLPVLSLKDLPESIAPVRQEVRTMDTTTLLHQDLETDGILYLTYFFSLEDLSLEELTPLCLMAGMLTKLPTRQFDLVELQSRIERHLGQLSVGVSAFCKDGRPDMCTPYLTVTVSLLQHRKREAEALLREVLFHTRFDQTAAVERLLRQRKVAMEQRVIAGGNRFATDVLMSGQTAQGAVEDALCGLTQLRYLQGKVEHFAEEGEDLCAEFDRLCKKALTRERLTLSLTGPMDVSWLEGMRTLIPEGGGIGPKAEYALPSKDRFALEIPADIGFAACGGHLSAAGASYSGVERVAAQILTYGYLWETVRVKGGAYGTRLEVGPDGTWSMTSFRDPGCSRTLDTFRGAGEALRTFCRQEESLDKCIISTVGDSQRLLTPRLEGLRAATLYLTGRTQADLQQSYTEILHTTREQLEAFSFVLDDLCETAAVCVVGGKRLLDDCGTRLDKRELLTQKFER